jgi:hypothetical protein
LRALDEARRAAYRTECADRRVHAAWDGALRALEESLVFRHGDGWNLGCAAARVLVFALGAALRV